MKTKICDLCAREETLLYRVQIKKGKDWIFVCAACCETAKTVCEHVEVVIENTGHSLIFSKRQYLCQGKLLTLPPITLEMDAREGNTDLLLDSKRVGSLTDSTLSVWANYKGGNGWFNKSYIDSSNRVPEFI